MRFHRAFRAILFTAILTAFAAGAFAQIGINITIAPPVLPVYDQPLCPGDGYLWTPGYWAWGDDDYYWVPGTWVEAPEVGFLWTPPWWGWEGGFYRFHEGFWGPQVGFYGGINYGFGYFGTGFYGGRWQGDHFFYNREVMNVNVANIHNVYNEHVTINNNTHVAFNGGRGGIEARPTPEEEAAARGRHVGPVGAQTQHEQAARSNPQFRASANHGRPPVAATARPGEFREGAVPAREGGEVAANRATNGVHPKDLPPAEHMPAPNTGNPKMDQKYQKQQQKLESQQNKERQQLQKQQDKEHAQLAKQNANDERKQQVEQKHQQQTQAMSQRHTEQRQAMQTRATAPSRSGGGGHPR